MKAPTVLLLVLLAACGSKPPAPPQPARAAVPATPPPADTTIVSAPIPAVLLEARRAPYAEPADGTCAGLTAQVNALDAVLGVDLDLPPLPGNPGLIERGAEPAGQTAAASLRGAAESVAVPRSWVRRPSGAERYSRDVAAAIAGGTVRRAYLKGLGQVRGCNFPAAPATANPG